MPKKKTKKSSKTTTPHGVIHKIKSKFSKGFVKVGFLVVVAVVALTAVGYVGFAKYKESSLKAKAASVTRTGVINMYWSNQKVTVDVYACRRQVQSVFGPLNNVSVYYKKTNVDSWARTPSTDIPVKTMARVNKWGDSRISTTPWYNSWWGTLQAYSFLGGSTNATYGVVFQATYDGSNPGGSSGGEISTTVSALPVCT